MAVPSSRSSPYHGRCPERDYPRDDGFKSGVSISTDASESPAPLKSAAKSRMARTMI